MTDFLIRVIDAWLENEHGERIENVELGEPIRLRAVVEARQDLENPGFTLQAMQRRRRHLRGEHCGATTARQGP